MTTNTKKAAAVKKGIITIIKMRDKDTGRVEEKEVVTYKGLLAEAHKKGIASIVIDELQLPLECNGWVAIMKATITLTGKNGSNGMSVSEIGDASPRNVNARIKPHLIRMAATRAKARALRDLLNIGVVSMEELLLDEPSEPVTNPKIKEYNVVVNEKLKKLTEVMCNTVPQEYIDEAEKALQSGSLQLLQTTSDFLDQKILSEGAIIRIRKAIDAFGAAGIEIPKELKEKTTQIYSLSLTDMSNLIQQLGNAYRSLVGNKKND